MMKHLLSALRFLTVIPLKAAAGESGRLAGSMIYFPVVGLLLGIFLSGADSLLVLLSFNDLVVNIILVVLLIIMTGGLHLDGLADTFDALMSGKDREGMLEVMRDPRIGTMGYLSIISVLLLKIGLLASVSQTAKTASLVSMCVLSRWSLVFSMFLFPYARREGKAKAFIDGVDKKKFTLASAITLALAIMLLKLNGLLVFGLVALCAYGFGRIMRKNIGGITGDSLGAICELAEVITLFGICVLWRVG